MRLAARRFWKDKRGSTLVEFAASAMILLMLILGIMQCSRALYADHFAANAAREATRYAAARGSTWHGTACGSPATSACEATGSDVLAMVQATAPAGIQPANLAVVTTWPGTDAAGRSCTGSGPSNSAGCMVVVRVQYSMTVMLPLLPTVTLPMSSTSALTIAQ